MKPIDICIAAVWAVAAVVCAAALFAAVALAEGTDPDPDGDGWLGDDDHCPHDYAVDNHGCPMASGPPPCPDGQLDYRSRAAASEELYGLLVATMGRPLAVDRDEWCTHVITGVAVGPGGDEVLVSVARDSFRRVPVFEFAAAPGG